MRVFLGGKSCRAKKIQGTARAINHDILRCRPSTPLTRPRSVKQRAVNSVTIDMAGRDGNVMNARADNVAAGRQGER